MSAVNRLDRRAAVAEAKEWANIARTNVELTTENARLRKTLAELQKERADEARLLRGLVKLVNRAGYSTEFDQLTITALDAHADPDISYVWMLIRAKKLKEKG